MGDMCRDWAVTVTGAVPSATKVPWWGSRIVCLGLLSPGNGAMGQQAGRYGNAIDIQRYVAVQCRIIVFMENIIYYILLINKDIKFWWKRKYPNLLHLVSLGYIPIAAFDDI